MFPGG